MAKKGRASRPLIDVNDPCNFDRFFRELFATRFTFHEYMAFRVTNFPIAWL